MKEYLDAARETVEYMNAITRMNHLSEDPFDHAKIINLGTTAWAFGVTPEMMNIFGRITASTRITAEDIRQLENQGITDYATRKPRKPWLDATHEEVWELTANGDTGPAIASTTHRHGGHVAFQFANGTIIYAADDGITAGRRIWPVENGGSDD